MQMPIVNQELEQGLLAIKKRFVGVENLPRFKLRDEAKQLFLSTGVVKPRRILNSRMATHRKNRFQQGLIVGRIPVLLGELVMEGFSLLELDEAWGAESPPERHR